MVEAFLIDLGFIICQCLQVAGRTNDAAGDGTTTASVLARELIHYGLQVSCTVHLLCEADNTKVSCMQSLMFICSFKLQAGCERASPMQKNSGMKDMLRPLNIPHAYPY